MMSKVEHEELTKKLWNNGLYCKSKSAHKVYQFMQFMDAENNPLEGQQVRREDKNLRPMGTPGFDESTARIVIYNFKEGVLHSTDDEPAVQYPGHWEYWKNGVIEKIFADGGDTEEYWENGVPVRIETNLAVRRSKEKQ